MGIETTLACKLIYFNFLFSLLPFNCFAFPLLTIFFPVLASIALRVLPAMVPPS
jgi:hypothetical protein